MRHDPVDGRRRARWGWGVHHNRSSSCTNDSILLCEGYYRLGTRHRRHASSLSPQAGSLLPHSGLLIRNLKVRFRRRGDRGPFLVVGGGGVLRAIVVSGRDVTRRRKLEFGLRRW